MAMITTPCYVTREQIMSAADVKYSAYMRDKVDEAVESASRRVDELTQRVFYPITATRYFDWPDQRYSPSWRFWIPTEDLISATALVSGGTTIASSDYDLRNGDDRPEPPYNRIEIDLSSAADFQAGDTTQRALAVTGRWGYRYDTASVATIVEGLDASETGVDVSGSSRVGSGDLIVVDSEHFLVTDRSMLDTGQNCTALTASQADVTITSVTGGSIEAGETILVDAERMLVQDVAGTTLTVRRAVDGTTLAAHSNGADIYAPRTLTVIRGAFGTTAATHSTSAALSVVTYPAPVRQLARAYALDQLQQEGSAYARVAGSGDNERQVSGRAITVLEDRVLNSRMAIQVKLEAI